MGALYLVEPKNQYKVPILVNPNEDQGKVDGFGRVRLAHGWSKLKFTFYASPGEIKNGWGKTPDVCCCSGVFGVALRAELKDDLFPNLMSGIEFLPIDIDGQDWLLLNCLNTTSKYDRDRTVAFRSKDQEIFFIQHVVVKDSAVLTWGIFTLEDSSRAQIIAASPFKERVEQLGLQGLNFREIGTLVPA